MCLFFRPQDRTLYEPFQHRGYSFGLQSCTIIMIEHCCSCGCRSIRSLRARVHQRHGLQIYRNAKIVQAEHSCSTGVGIFTAAVAFCLGGAELINDIIGEGTEIIPLGHFDSNKFKFAGNFHVPGRIHGVMATAALQNSQFYLCSVQAILFVNIQTI